jgi:hypothetical protein
VALEHTSVEVVVCSARNWMRFTCTVGRKIDLLLSSLHMPHRGDGFTVVSIMPPTLPQAGTLMLSSCFVETNNSLHRSVSAVRSRGIKHSIDSQEFVIGQGGIYRVPLEQKLISALLLQRYSSLLSRPPKRLPLTKRIDGAPALQERR